MTKRRLAAMPLILALLMTPIAPVQGASSESERFHRLLAEDWEYQMKEFPERATRIGYPGQDDRWTDHSLEAYAARERHLRELLEALESIDRTKLDAADRLNYDLYHFLTRDRLAGYAFPDHLMPVTQLDGVHRDVPELFGQVPTATVPDYENILARLKGIPRLVNQNLKLMEQGRASGLTPPKVTLRDLPGQLEGLIRAGPEASPFLVPFRKFPAAIPEAEQKRLRDAAVRALESEVVPAYRTLHDYLVKTYIPSARETTGWRDLPNGRNWYAHLVRHYTTTDLTPKQIHDLGLSEVRRIRAEMEKGKEQAGFRGTLAEFFEFLRTDPQFFFTKREDLLVGYRDIAKRIDPELVRVFGKLPRLPYGVIAIPAHIEVSQTSAYYQLGSPQAARPGYFYVNTYSLNSRPKWEMEALALHEAVPGHHLQIALAQELEGLPEFRRHSEFTAFIEGWALYAESLGEEMGFFANPYSKLGQLTFEMWRAIRLVVDTGLHEFGWSRQQAIDFFKENSPKPEHDIIVEVDRYLVSPGQALAYKIGELKIKELRAAASRELGQRFDLRSFHDEVLGQGALPMGVLEARINAWVKDQKTRAGETSAAVH
jgi:uncharacterized protein (DUF885 family)